MILTLEATGPRGAALGPAGRHAFSTAGGVVGRAKGSDWVLADAKVSGRHAVISFLDGVFYIEDTSTNGVFINSPSNRLVAGRRYALQQGDRILIDPYEIDVSISSREANAPPLTPGAAGEPLATGQPQRPLPPQGPSELAPMPGSDEVDPLKLIGAPQKRALPRQGPTAEELRHRPVISDHYQPPAVFEPPQLPADQFAIPAGYDPLLDDFIEPETPPVSPRPERPAPPSTHQPQRQAPVARQAEPQPGPQHSTYPPQPSIPEPPLPEDELPLPPYEPAPSEYAPAAAGSDTALAAMLSGAGLDGLVPTPELARDFGEIFRTVVEGVMDVLQSRSQVKDEFRMRMTQFRPADNNPLKFSANVDDALHNLLVKRNPAYLGPVEAFEDAFEDLRNHQIAMLAGMRVAFESLISQFDPERLEERFDRQLKRGTIIRAMAHSRYWDLYREFCEEIARDPEASFKKLFGEEFARAYEDQLRRLKGSNG